MQVPVNAANVGSFARDALMFARDVVTTSASFHLPGINLTICSNAPDYLALCSRALVSADFESSAQDIEVVVLSEAADQSIRMGLWNEKTFGASDLQPLAQEHIEAVYDVERGSWQFFDRLAFQGVQLTASTDRLPPWERSFPLRNFLHWTYGQKQQRLVHAGTLGINGRGILLVGAGGSGKSGTTLSGILAGMDSVGDDYIAMSREGDTFTARPVMKLMKQDQRGLRRNGLDSTNGRFGSINWQNKYEFDFEELGAGRRALGLDIVAIVIPKISGADHAAFSETNAMTVMQQMGLSTLAQLPGDWKAGLHFIADLARSVPCYTLDLSEAPHINAEAIANLIAGRPR